MIVVRTVAAGLGYIVGLMLIVALFMANDAFEDWVLGLLGI